MKRALVIISLTLAVLLVGIVALVASAFIGRQGINDGAESNGVRIVKDGIVSFAVFSIGDRDVALIDAGNDSEAKAIRAELTRRQLSVDAVKAIFLTHGHADHIGGVHDFPNAQVYALEREVPLIEGREQSRGPATKLMPVRPTGITVQHPLHDGDVVHVGGNEVRVFALPGHTAGSAAYLVNSVLLMGDAADIASDGSLVKAPWLFSDDQSEDRQSLIGLSQRIQHDQLPVAALVCAHSGLSVTGNGLLSAFVRSHR